MIKVNGITKTFRVHKRSPGLKSAVRALFKREWVENQALKGVSLEVKGGEILGLVGANGAGKTTLVKILAGIIHPTAGQAEVLGFVPWKRDNEFRRQISLIMGQKAQLWWDLPAADCFLLLKEIYRIPENEFKSSLEFLVETLQVSGQMNVQIRRLSLGERMKMELIAALLHRPRVVFLDEPTIGLDITAQKSIRKFILEYLRQFKPAVILTSHYMEDIEQLCERIVIIQEGKFVYDGPLSEITTKYARSKIISAEIDGEGEFYPPDGIEVLSAQDGVLKVRVDREKVPQVASEILNRYPVLDLSIDEDDISTIIEALMRSGAKRV